MDWPHLTKAPVKEAIVDIRIAPRSTVDAATLLALHKQFEDFYPNAQPRNKIEGIFSFSGKPGQPGAAEIKDQGVDGYLFRSNDDLNVVQMRVDGFSYSRLAPYTEWREIKVEAVKLWAIYSKAVGAFSVNRVAMRYINLLNLDGAPSDLSKYTDKAPAMPAAIESKIFGYLEQTFLNDSRNGLQATLTQVVQPPPAPAKFEYILDIDVFLQNQSGIPEDSIWPTFEKIRDYKNRIFFGTLKKETWEAYK